MSHGADQQIEPLELIDHAGVQHDRLVAQPHSLRTGSRFRCGCLLEVDAEIQHRLASLRQASLVKELLQIHAVRDARDRRFAARFGRAARPAHWPVASTLKKS